LHALANGLRAYQRSGIQPWLRRLGLLRLAGLEAQAALAPAVPAAALRRGWPEVLQPYGARRARVLFLRGCVTPEVLPAMQHASLEALRHNGCEVVTPPEQVCCGALHFHTGFRSRGLELLARNVGAFAGPDFDAILVNAAVAARPSRNTVTWPRESRPWRNPRPHSRAASVISTSSSWIWDWHRLRSRSRRVSPTTSRVTLLHGQRISSAPRAILAAIPGLDLVPLRDADRCCGSAGIYNLAQPELAGAILAEKVRHIAASGADVVATGNPGCILQIRSGLRQASAAEPRLGAIRVLHPMELLAAGYGNRIE
jgi:glycolate oxidase iron-sulfur subunit